MALDEVEPYLEHRQVNTHRLFHTCIAKASHSSTTLPIVCTVHTKEEIHKSNMQIINSKAEALNADIKTSVEML